MKPRDMDETEVRAMIEAMTMSERQELIDRLYKAGWLTVATYLQQMLDAHKRELN